MLHLDLRISDNAININRFRDVLDLLFAHKFKIKIQFSFNRIKNQLRYANATSGGESFNSCRYIDTIAIQCAIVLGDNVSQVESNAKLHLSVLGKLTVAVANLFLDIYSCGQRLDPHGDHRNACLVITHQARVANHVGTHYCGHFPSGFSHKMLSLYLSFPKLSSYSEDTVCRPVGEPGIT